MARPQGLIVGRAHAEVNGAAINRSHKLILASRFFALLVFSPKSSVLLLKTLLRALSTTRLFAWIGLNSV
jgi:hypothetical protein